MSAAFLKLVIPCAFVLVFERPLRAQDNVTVPKSRLEELERKEKELDRLKGDVSKTKAENAELKEKLEQTSTNVVAAPAPSRPIPPLATLPPLQAGDVIDSKDLVTWYRQEPAAAESRFHNQRLTIAGEIAGFEKPLMKHDYHVLLPGNEPTAKVICDFYPPEKYNAVFVANHGAQLDGQIGETRIPLARVGDHVLIKGTCKGLHGSCVLISAGELTQVLAPVK